MVGITNNSDNKVKSPLFADSKYDELHTDMMKAHKFILAVVSSCSEKAAELKCPTFPYVATQLVQLVHKCPEGSRLRNEAIIALHQFVDIGEISTAFLAGMEDRPSGAVDAIAVIAEDSSEDVLKKAKRFSDLFK